MIGALTGVLASRNTAHEYFTSALYPFVVDDSIGISSVLPRPSTLWENPNDDVVFSAGLISGTLVETIVYRTYNEPLAVESVGFGLPVPQLGTLVETIAYKTYNESLAVDNVGFGLPTPLSGTLVETISYVNYNNADPNQERVAFNNPIIISGTLV